MAAVICMMITLLLSSGIYIIWMQQQLHLMNQQLEKRLIENTQQPVSLELINQELIRLAANINKCLKAEELLRLNGIREEKQFKEMIANISHDLRTPLTAIKGYQQLMSNDLLSAEQRMRLLIAQKHADELELLIGHFFEYSYLQNLKLPLSIDKINISNLITECIADAVPIFEKHHLEVEIKEPFPVLYVFADREMIIRMIRNLIQNCIAHSVGNITVNIRERQFHKIAVITFSNPVANIDEIAADRLFDRFYTVGQTRGKTTGLGLSIVTLLAEQMGGSAGAVLTGQILNVSIEIPLAMN